MDKRPELTKPISVKDFKEFYWLKNELINFCRTESLGTSGGKREIENRIECYLKTGQNTKPSKKIKPQSTFNWSSELLSLDTIITDNYKNSENVRAFFKFQIGKQFRFNVRFMNWMKANVGKTLKDSINQYGSILVDNIDNSAKKHIAPQFEYNTYLRYFLENNPNSGRELGIKLWNIKRTLRGNNVYTKEDFKLIEKE